VSKSKVIKLESKIDEKLDELEIRIKSNDYLEDCGAIRSWGGADVIIRPKMTKKTERWLGNQNLVVSAQKTVPRKRAVITSYFQELSWLFNQLKNIFRGRIDYISKYDFYGSLAQAAIDYIESADKVERETLLLTVVGQARKFNSEYY